MKILFFFQNNNNNKFDIDYYEHYISADGTYLWRLFEPVWQENPFDDQNEPSPVYFVGYKGSEPVFRVTNVHGKCKSQNSTIIVIA